MVEGSLAQLRWTLILREQHVRGDVAAMAGAMKDGVPPLWTVTLSPSCLPAGPVWPEEVHQHQ